jgi:hypothetical protein
LAEILIFPAERFTGAAHRIQHQPFEIEEQEAGAGAEAWLEAEACDGTSLGLVARLAAEPSGTLTVLARKMEVLVDRLVPDEDHDAGLCAAEAQLLQSVLNDIRAFAADITFAARGAALWTPAPEPS